MGFSKMTMLDLSHIKRRKCKQGVELVFEDAYKTHFREGVS